MNNKNAGETSGNWCPGPSSGGDCGGPGILATKKYLRMHMGTAFPRVLPRN